MRYSLDSHIVIWWFNDPDQIRESVLNILKDKENELFVSSAVIWEITIKASIGKLKLSKNFISEVKRDFVELPILWNHAFEIGKLENLHQDPFDRLLIAQAKAENLIFITKDKNILKYSFNVLKA